MKEEYLSSWYKYDWVILGDGKKYLKLTDDETGEKRLFFRAEMEELIRIFTAALGQQDKE